MMRKTVLQRGRTELNDGPLLPRDWHVLTRRLASWEGVPVRVESGRVVDLPLELGEEERAPQQLNRLGHLASLR